MLRKFEPVVTNDYPTSDGRPMAETDYHRKQMIELIQTLEHRFEEDADVYVSGNMLVFYEEGNRRRHLAPDAFVVYGVPKMERLNYLIWEEGKGPDVVFEITSKTTRAEDTRKKYDLYLNRLGAREYFVFDPFEEYLSPSMQGFRKVAGKFRPVKPAAGRLPSKVLGLHLERNGKALRLWDPATGGWLRNKDERIAEGRERAEAERERAETERTRADAMTVEVERQRREIEALKRRLAGET